MKRLQRDVAGESLVSPSKTGTHSFVKVGILVVIAFIFYTASTESTVLRSLAAKISETAETTTKGLLKATDGYANTSDPNIVTTETSAAPVPSMFDKAAGHVYASILQEQNETLSSIDSNTKIKELDLATWTTRTEGGLRDDDRKLLAAIYANATSVFEYGVGESTYIANHMGVARYAGVDSHPGYLNDVRSKVSPKFRFYYGDVGNLKNWGYPADTKLTKILWQYQVAPLYSEPEPFDVYFVDGRYRVACVLFSFLHASAKGAKHADTIVMIHDCARNYYHGNDDILELVASSPRYKGRAGLCVYKRKPDTTDEILLQRYEVTKHDPA
ncbi:MAG: hypothetical protein SGILL_006438 [Bacillariaceae sp.]